MHVLAPHFPIEDVELVVVVGDVSRVDRTGGEDHATSNVVTVHRSRASLSADRSSSATTFDDRLMSWSSACSKSSTDMERRLPAARIAPPTLPAPRTRGERRSV